MDGLDILMRNCGAIIIDACETQRHRWCTCLQGFRALEEGGEEGENPIYFIVDYGARARPYIYIYIYITLSVCFSSRGSKGRNK